MAGQYPDLSEDTFRAAVQFITPAGDVYSAAHAVFLALATRPLLGWLLALYRFLPGFAPLSEWAYRLVTNNRPFFHSLTNSLFRGQLVPSQHRLTRWLFLRLLGVVYLIAFLSFHWQSDGLIGSNGISPVADYMRLLRTGLGPRAVWTLPGLFWLDTSDALLQALGIGGIVLSLLLIVGLAQQIALLLLFIGYLTVMQGGQQFFAFQWDALLLETGFLAIFLAPSRLLPRPIKALPPSRAIIWLLRWLLFRLMFSSGLVKLLSGDPNWRSFDALAFHYQTQPLPSPLAWYAHQLPRWFQQASVAGMFAIEIAVPFLFFMPRRVRFVGAWLTLGFQALIMLTGNYTFFNWVTIALCLTLFDDAALQQALPQRIVRRLMPAPTAARRGRGVVLQAALALLTVALLYLSAATLPVLRTNGLTNRARAFHITSSYGLFAVMTTNRPEIIIEGSNDGQTWLVYEFRHKPGDVTQVPRWVAPFQPRLDWQMWFAALSTVDNNQWFFGLAVRLMQGSPQVLALLETNPFPDAPPGAIRAVVYDYQFTDGPQRRATGDWWRRVPLGFYLTPVALAEEEIGK